MRYLWIAVVVVALLAYGMSQSQAQSSAVETQAWEYLSFIYATNEDGDHLAITDFNSYNTAFDCMAWCEGQSLIVYMDTLGLDGWEALSIDRQSGNTGTITTVYFKRPAT